jgi:hypothetical protein
VGICLSCDVGCQFTLLRVAGTVNRRLDFEVVGLFESFETFEFDEANVLQLVAED